MSNLNKPKIIIANWKMNPVSFGEAESLIKTIKKGIKKSDNTKIIICPPAVYISKIKPNSNCFNWSFRKKTIFEVNR